MTTAALTGYEDDDQMQMIRDDEDCFDKQSNIQKSITNSHYNSPRMDRKGDFQADINTSQHSFLKFFGDKSY